MLTPFLIVLPFKIFTGASSIKVLDINSISFLSILISLEIDFSFLDLSFIIFFISVQLISDSFKLTNSLGLNLPFASFETSLSKSIIFFRRLCKLISEFEIKSETISCLFFISFKSIEGNESHILIILEPIDVLVLSIISNKDLPP